MDSTSEAIKTHGAAAVYAAAVKRLEGDKKALSAIGVCAQTLGEVNAIMTAAFERMSKEEKAADYWCASQHGGPREGAGRKPIEGTKPEMKSIKISREHWQRAREIGNGNMTEGIRMALDAYRIDSA